MKPLRAQPLGVLGLAEQRQVLGQQLGGGGVEVVLVQVRDQRGVDALDDDLGRLRQLDERVAAVVLGVLHRRPRACRVEHRVDEQLAAVDLEPQRRVADQAQVHPAARYPPAGTTPTHPQGCDASPSSACASSTRACGQGCRTIPSRGRGDAGARCCCARRGRASACSTSAAAPAASSPRCATRAPSRSASRSPRRRSSARGATCRARDLRLAGARREPAARPRRGRPRLVLGGARARARHDRVPDRGPARAAARRAAAGHRARPRPAQARADRARPLRRALRPARPARPLLHAPLARRARCGRPGSTAVRLGRWAAPPLLRHALVARAVRG